MTAGRIDAMETTGERAASPGIASIVDGSEAIAHVETRISEVACADPITPSTTMAAIVHAAVAAGRPNLWGTRLAFIEPESEHSSALAAEGVALAGRGATDFTAGRGLIGTDGTPTPEILATQRSRLANRHSLQELAGIR